MHVTVDNLLCITCCSVTRKTFISDCILVETVAVQNYFYHTLFYVTPHCIHYSAFVFRLKIG